MKIIISYIMGFVSCWIIFFGLLYLGESFPLGAAGVSEVKAPADHIKEKNIIIKDDKIIIKINGASISRYAPTGSMRPVLDTGANGIRIVPSSPDEIHVGDIISYKWGTSLIVHRVIEKGIDGKGVYFITKGDNNRIPDGKVRFKDIKFLTVGILW
ncbi:signal peptidase I [Candidatus Pacearchaeota archaeon]|nr:MAG: signal peptidase I [Candidatus Pacearchaeota archaeon]